MAAFCTPTSVRMTVDTWLRTVRLRTLFDSTVCSRCLWLGTQDLRVLIGTTNRNQHSFLQVYEPENIERKAGYWNLLQAIAESGSTGALVLHSDHFIHQQSGLDIDQLSEWAITALRFLDADWIHVQGDHFAWA